MSNITYRRTSSMIDAFNAKVVLDGLADTYPDFDDWFVNKVIPNVVTGTGALILAEQNQRIIGMAVGKTGEETKFQCLRVLPEFQGRGVGVHLIDRLLRDLDKDKPLTTVSEGFMHDLSRIFVNRFSFDLTRVDRGLYKPGVLEYVFNDRAADLAVKSPY